MVIVNKRDIDKYGIELVLYTKGYISIRDNSGQYKFNGKHYVISNLHDKGDKVIVTFKGILLSNNLKYSRHIELWNRLCSKVDLVIDVYSVSEFKYITTIKPDATFAKILPNGVEQRGDNIHIVRNSSIGRLDSLNRLCVDSLFGGEI